MTTTVADQGMSQDLDIGKHLETDMGKEDRGREVRAPEDRGKEATALEVVEEEEEDMKTGEVMLAMGQKLKKSPRDPRSWGVSCRRPHG